MPWSTDVSLPRDQTPLFPDHCVVCLVERPERTIAVTQATASVFGIARAFIWFLLLIPADKVKAQAPICPRCRRSELASRWWWRVIGLGLVAAGITTSCWLYPAGGKLMMLGFAIAACLPWIVLRVLLPPAFDLTVSRRSVDYEFRSSEYAEEFAELNGGEAI